MIQSGTRLPFFETCSALIKNYLNWNDYALLFLQWLVKMKPIKLVWINFNTRMDSSRMRTARSLTMGCTCTGGVSAQGSTCLGGVCLGGTMWPIPSCIWCYQYAAFSPTETHQQCSCLYTAGWPARHAWDTPPPPRGQNSWHMLLKILPCPNFVAGGNKLSRFITGTYNSTTEINGVR